MTEKEEDGKGKIIETLITKGRITTWLILALMEVLGITGIITGTEIIDVLKILIPLVLVTEVAKK